MRGLSLKPVRISLPVYVSLSLKPIYPYFQCGSLRISNLGGNQLFSMEVGEERQMNRSEK